MEEIITIETTKHELTEFISGYVVMKQMAQFPDRLPPQMAELVGYAAYKLCVPFMDRILDLASPGDETMDMSAKDIMDKLEDIVK